jgi:peptidoglycan/LPS O-acetylase OafA/YrhL
MTRTTAPAGPVPQRTVGGDLPVLWSLNGLRAAGALLVMLYHVNSWDLQVIRGSSAGFTGVGLFFVLSGFVLTWTARPGTTLGTFYRRRLARILPNHLVTFALGVLVTVLVLGVTPDPTAVLTGVFLVQAWSPDEQMVFALNGVAWSLSCEIAFYSVFPLLLWALRRVPARTRAVVAGVALATPAIIGTIWPALIPLLFHLPPSRLPEFVLGMVTALAVQEGWRPRVPAPVCLGLLAAGVLGAAWFDGWSPVVLTAVLAAVFAPLAARCAWGDVAGRNRWARHPVVLLAGGLSFAFYLVHELVIKVLVASPVRGPVTIPLVLVVSGVLALAVYRGVEVPGRRFLLAVGTRRRPAGAHGTTGDGPRHGRSRTAAWSAPVPSHPADGAQAGGTRAAGTRAGGTRAGGTQAGGTQAPLAPAPSTPAPARAAAAPAPAPGAPAAIGPAPAPAGALPAPPPVDAGVATSLAVAAHVGGRHRETAPADGRATRPDRGGASPAIDAARDGRVTEQRGR